MAKLTFGQSVLLRGRRHLRDRVQGLGLTAAAIAAAAAAAVTAVPACQVASPMVRFRASRVGCVMDVGFLLEGGGFHHPNLD